MLKDIIVVAWDALTGSVMVVFICLSVVLGAIALVDIISKAILTYLD